MKGGRVRKDRFPGGEKGGGLSGKTALLLKLNLTGKGIFIRGGMCLRLS